MSRPPYLFSPTAASIRQTYHTRKRMETEVRSGQMETLWLLLTSVYDFPQKAAAEG